MNFYVVAFVDYHSNKIEQAKVAANSKADAMRAILHSCWKSSEYPDTKEFVDSLQTVEELETAVFDADCLISAIEI